MAYDWKGVQYQKNQDKQLNFKNCPMRFLKKVITN